MYSKINWQANTLLTPARFRHMETQYDAVISYQQTNSFRIQTGEELVAEIIDFHVDSPTAHAGRLIFDIDSGNLWFGDGATWVELEGE